MTQTIAARIAAQRAEDLRILANQADRAGIRILATRDGEHLATSLLDPTALHRLTSDTCDCLHFTCFGRCRHLALFLSELGVIPDDADAGLEALVDDRWGALVDDGTVDEALLRPAVLLIKAADLALAS